jgi:HK97 family phage prohead protease
MERTLPRDNLVRASSPGFELRAASEDGGMPTMHGHFAVFNQWAEINSIFEGHFLERVSPGALTKTFKENRAQMRALFQHGRDPQVGDKPLGSIELLEEDSIGGRYEVGLLDTSYVRDLLPALEAGLYGASYRFRVTREDYVHDPKRSDYNPDGIPERTIKEMAVREFGPVTFPAYEGATAGVRSLTDDFLLEALLQEPDKLRALLESREQVKTREEVEVAPPEDDAAAEHLVSGRRANTLYGQTPEPGKEPWRL